MAVWSRPHCVKSSHSNDLSRVKWPVSIMKFWLILDIGNYFPPWSCGLDSAISFYQTGDSMADISTQRSQRMLWVMGGRVELPLSIQHSRRHKLRSTGNINSGIDIHTQHIPLGTRFCVALFLVTLSNVANIYAIIARSFPWQWGNRQFLLVPVKLPEIIRLLLTGTSPQ